MRGSSFEQEFKINTVQDGVEFGPPEVKSGFPVKAVITKNSAREFTLKLNGSEIKSESGRFSVEITVPVNSPDGWAPVKVILTGRVKNAGK